MMRPVSYRNQLKFILIAFPFLRWCDAEGTSFPLSKAEEHSAYCKRTLCMKWFYFGRVCVCVSTAVAPQYFVPLLLALNFSCILLGFGNKKMGKSHFIREKWPNNIKANSFCRFSPYWINLFIVDGDFVNEVETDIFGLLTDFSWCDQIKVYESSHLTMELS